MTSQKHDGLPTPGEALEAALAENPDDLAAHHAYADWLMEQGDPRGEFIQVQLALEDPNRTEAQRKEFLGREKSLLNQHARHWLGDLGRFLHGPWSGEDKPYYYQFARGWLTMVRVLTGVYEQEQVDAAIVAALARSPEACLLRRLELVYDMRHHPFDFDPFVEGPNQALTGQEGLRFPSPILTPLLDSPCLPNLRAFKLGFSDTADTIAHSTMVRPFEGCTAQQLIELLQKWPRLEELYLNTDLPDIGQLFASPKVGNLAVFQYYFGTNYGGNQPGGAYPLRILANNASLTRLTHLKLHPGRDETIDLAEMNAVLCSTRLPSLAHLQVHMTTFGDEGCGRIVQSGILRRLKSLDIAYGNMTDEGARSLARSPDLKNLEVLDVSRNALTPEGISVLQSVGIRVVAENQHAPDEEDYLYEVDME